MKPREPLAMGKTRPDRASCKLLAGQVFPARSKIARTFGKLVFPGFAQTAPASVENQCVVGAVQHPPSPAGED